MFLSNRYMFHITSKVTSTGSYDDVSVHHWDFCAGICVCHYNHHMFFQNRQLVENVNAPLHKALIFHLNLFSNRLLGLNTGIDNVLLSPGSMYRMINVVGMYIWEICEMTSDDCKNVPNDVRLKVPVKCKLPSLDTSLIPEDTRYKIQIYSPNRPYISTPKINE